MTNAERPGQRTDGQPAPMISIIMSVYNCESTLLDALKSIFDQTYTDWELIVCDDASTDGTLPLLREAVAGVEQARVTILRNGANRRLAYSLNRCLAAASGQFIARMDADDISEPDRLERQMQFLEEHPDVDLVGTAMRRFNDHGLGDIVMPPSLAPDKRTLGQSTSVPFCHATILARKSAYDAAGGYTISWRTERGQDLDLWFKFFGAGLVGRNLPDPLYRVREDEAAVRRRTPKARFGSVVTRIRGSWRLGYPLRAYSVPLMELMKILVPYRVVYWYRERSRRASTETLPGA